MSVGTTPQPDPSFTHVLAPRRTVFFSERSPYTHVTHDILLLVGVHQMETLRRLNTALEVLYRADHSIGGRPIFEAVVLELTPQWWGALTSHSTEKQAEIQKGLLCSHAGEPLSLDPAAVQALQRGEVSWVSMPQLKAGETPCTLSTPMLKVEVHRHEGQDPQGSQLVLAGTSKGLTSVSLSGCGVGLSRRDRTLLDHFMGWKNRFVLRRKGPLSVTHLAVQKSPREILWLPLTGENLWKLRLAAQALNGRTNTVTAHSDHLQPDLLEVHFSMEGFVAEDTTIPIAPLTEGATEVERVLHQHRHRSWQEHRWLFVKDHTPPASGPPVSVRVHHQYAAHRGNPLGVLRLPDVHEPGQSIDLGELSRVLQSAIDANGNFPLPEWDEEAGWVHVGKNPHEQPR